MEAMNQAFLTIQASPAPTDSIRTTLHDLVEAIGQELRRGEEGYITEIVVQMIRSGRIRRITAPAEPRRCERL